MSTIYRAVKPIQHREYRPLSSSNPEVQSAMDRLNPLNEDVSARADQLP